MKWTKDDLEILREIYPINPKYCAEILERSYGAVSVKASKLGISKNVRNTPENYAKKLLAFNLKPLSEFEGAEVESLFECLLCGEHFSHKPANVLYKQSGCPNCTFTNGKLTKEELAERVPKEYQLLDDKTYGVMKKHNYKHLICGHEWEVKPNDLINGYGCPECATTGPVKANIVYLFHFPELGLYKLGRSSNPTRRALQFGYKCNIVWTEEYPNYIEASKREKELLEGVKLVNTGLLKSGNTETFYEINDKIRRL